MIFYEQKQAAEVLGVTPRTLRDWRANHPDFPDCNAGYDIAAIEAWRSAHAAKGSDSGDQATKINLALKAQQLRIKKAEADKREREEERARGNILPRDEYETALVECITLCRDQLMAIPKHLARLVPRKHQRKLQDEGTAVLRKILDEFAARVERIEEDLSD